MERITFLILIAVFIYSCTENQSTNNESKLSNSTLPDRYVDIGTHRVHINDFGKGSPVVVFVTGTGGAINQWERQVHEIDKYTRVITYDRAGLGKSESSKEKKSLESITNELHLVLEKENIPGPYVLAAHSMGGSIIRYYRYLYPKKVAGMVFIDALGNDYYGRYDNFPEMKTKWFEGIDSVSAIYQGGVKDEMEFLKYRDERKDTMLKIGYPKDIPLKIIQSMLIGEEGVVDEIDKNKKDSLFTEMAKNDLLIDYVKTDKSGHFIHWYEPSLVNEAIIDLIKEIRRE